MALAAAIARGVTEGVQGYGENMRRAAIADREEKRFAWEERDQAEKERVRKAASDFSEQMKLAREQFSNGKLPGQEDNIAEQAPVEEAAPRTAIAAPGAAPAAPAKPADSVPRTENIFKNNGEGIYKDQRRANEAYWDRLRNITAAYYEQTGQVDKLMEVDKKISEWKNSAYDEIRKAAAAAVATGDPGALDMVNKVGQMTGLGVKMDGSKAVFDSKSQTWKGVRVVGTDGKEAVRDVSAVSLLSTLGSLAPEKLIEFNISRADKDRQYGLDERKVRSDERVADARVAESAATAEFRRAQRGALDDSIKGSNAKALSETLTKQFPMANEQITLEKKMGKSPEELEKWQSRIDSDTKGLALSELLVGLNPKLDPRVIAAAAKSSFGGGMNLLTDPKSGRKYIEYGGAKIFTN